MIILSSNVEDRSSNINRPVKFEDSEVESGVEIGSDRTILRKFVISQPFHKVSKLRIEDFVFNHKKGSFALNLQQCYANGCSLASLLLPISICKKNWEKTSLQIEGDHVNFSHNECNTVAKESVCHRCWKFPPSPLSSPNLSN